ncbi:MAG: glycosyltransferase [Chlorobium sp.]|nr:MAG: glycosyltransferase [Chlorobium sp.]
MRLLLVSAGDFFSSYGGGQIYLKNLVDRLIDAKFELVILSPINVDRSTGSYRNKRVIYYAPNDDFSCRILRDIFVDVKPDVVHAHGMKSKMAEFCHELGIPCLVTAHHGGILCPAGALLNKNDAICKVKASHNACLPCVLNNIRWGGYAHFFLKMFSVHQRLKLAYYLQQYPFFPYISPVCTATLTIDEKINEWSRIYRYSSKLIAPSRAIAESMMLNGAPAEKIAIVSHGSAVPQVVRGKKNDAPEYSTSSLKFFFVGRISYEKGLHVLLKALSRISGENLVELHVVGGAETKNEIRYLLTLRKIYRHDERIVWHGKKKYADMNKLIEPFDVLVHPAICLEVYGLTIAEAHMMQKPVIATRCGGPEDQIRDGVNGLLVEPNNSEELRKAMEKLIKNRALIAIMSERASEGVVTMEEHAQKLINLYRQCLEQS